MVAKKTPKKPPVELVLILHNIRSALNVGALFRTAEAAGVRHIYLTGYTPTPENPKVAKTGLGAEDWVPWTQRRQISRVMAALQKNGFVVVGLELDPRSVDLFAWSPSGKVALILGNEVTGIDRAIRARCDTILEIPMHGRKESLNVSVAGGIAMYALTDHGSTSSQNS